MTTRRLVFLGVWAVFWSLVGSAQAQSFVRIYRDYKSAANPLAQRAYLLDLLPTLSQTDNAFAKQLLSTVDAKLGLYQEAINDFPFDNRIPMQKPLPPLSHWSGIVPVGNMAYFSMTTRLAMAYNAVDEITKQAQRHRIVLINEVHHDAHTRVLILQLLPRLRSLGYDYFACEALQEDGDTLQKRGYPIATSGSDYLQEPIYAEVVRTAIHLGYKIIPYDSANSNDDRDHDQAQTLYQRVFAHDHAAKLLVEAGYAHIEKERGHLGQNMPMAAQLVKLTGIDPLAVDQSQFHESAYEQSSDPYTQLIESFSPRSAFVLKLQGSSTPWSSDPARYDISVILPQSGPGKRPDWLDLDGLRKPWSIDSTLCNSVVPCVVEARYANESDEAIPADRYTFLDARVRAKLFLKPGIYRLRSWGMNGRTWQQQIIHVGN